MIEDVGIDEATHKYFTLPSKKPLVSVTQTLKHFGFIDDRWFDPFSRQVGKSTHYGIHLVRKKIEIDPQTLDPLHVAPRLRALDKFDRETGWVSLFSEFMTRHPLHPYAGTVDDLGYFMGGSAFYYQGPGLVDYKSGKVCQWAAYQTGGYERCQLPPAFRDLLPPQFRDKPIRRFGVQLMPDGNYDLVPFADPHDGDLFCSLLPNLIWKLNHGYKL